MCLILKRPVQQFAEQDVFYGFTTDAFHPLQEVYP